jgi:hypothetical protein
MKNKTVTQMKSEATIPNSATESEVTRSVNDLQGQVRCRACKLYEQRGKEDGHEIDYWPQVESELAAGTIKATA